MLHLLLTIAVAAGVQDMPLGAFSYATDTEARAHWVSQGASPPVRVVTLDDGTACLAFDAAFKAEGDRVCWDWMMPLDLSEGGRVAFEVSALGSADANVFGIYFGTDTGWYAKTWLQQAPERWARPLFPLSSFGQEESPAGWDKITKFRFSVWGVNPGEITYLVRNLHIIPKDPGENLLLNGSFEIPGKEIPYGWGSGHWGVGDMPWAADMDLWRGHWGLARWRHKDGRRSLRIENTPDLPLLKARSLWIALPEEGDYVLSAWLKSDQDELPVIMRFAGGERLAEVGKKWQQVVLGGPMPNRNRPMAEIAPQAPGKLWIDAVQLQALADPTEEFHAHFEDEAIAARQEDIDWSPPRRTPDVAQGRRTVGPITGAKASIDEHGRFLLDGKPYIQHSFGLEFVDDLSILNAVADAGFKDICIQIHPHVTTDELRTYFDRCAEAGLRVIPWLDGRIERERYADHIRALRDHAAFLCWYVYDEPSGERFEEANARLNLARELDPSRPALINYLANKLTGHMGDIFSTDVYPIPHGTPMAAVSAVRTMAAEAKTLKRPVWMWLQSTGYAYGIAREPTPRELSCMVYGSLIEGARGIYYFAQMPRSEGCLDEMRALCVEVDALEPVLYSLEPAPEVSCDADSVLLQAYALDGTVTVLAVNTQNESKAVRFQLPAGDGRVRVQFEERSRKMKEGAWNDEFGPYERHVYQVE